MNIQVDSYVCLFYVGPANVFNTSRERDAQLVGLAEAKYKWKLYRLRSRYLGQVNRRFINILSLDIDQNEYTLKKGE